MKPTDGKRVLRKLARDSSLIGYFDSARPNPDGLASVRMTNEKATRFPRIDSRWKFHFDVLRGPARARQFCIARAVLLCDGLSRRFPPIAGGPVTACSLTSAAVQQRITPPRSLPAAASSTLLDFPAAGGR